MKKLEERLQTIRKHVEKNEITVMILGLKRGDLSFRFSGKQK